MRKEKTIQGNSSGPQPCASFQEGITCSNLKVNYRKHIAIENLTGAFQPGTMTAIVGPNGGGKSTLLKAINGFITPSSGFVSLGVFKKKDLAYLPQNTAVDRSFPLRVHDVVAMGLYPDIGFYGKFPKGSNDKIMAALESVGLQDCAKRPLHALSGGQFQRVLFARMALQNARAILLDEPFAAIDAPTMELLANLLTQWQANGKTIITVLHDMDIVREFFPSTLVLARRSIAWGHTKEVLVSNVLKKAKHLACTWDTENFNNGTEHA